MVQHASCGASPLNPDMASAGPGARRHMRLLRKSSRPTYVSCTRWGCWFAKGAAIHGPPAYDPKPPRKNPRRPLRHKRRLIRKSFRTAYARCTWWGCWLAKGAAFHGPLAHECSAARALESVWRLHPRPSKASCTHARTFWKSLAHNPEASENAKRLRA